MNTYEEQILTALNNTNAEYIAWYTGTKDQAHYIIKYSKYLNNNTIALPLPDSAIKGDRKVLSEKFLDYFFLDFPDIIISKKDELDRLPIVGIEILEQKPVGWNHTQRFARAAASAILSVPFAYLMPQKRYLFDKYTGSNPKRGNVIQIGDELYKENLRQEFQLLFSLFKLSNVHQIPCLAFFWPIDDKYKYLSEGLVYNSDPELRWRQLPPAPINQKGNNYPEIKSLFRFIDIVIDYHNKSISPELLMNENIIKQELDKISPDKTTLYTLQHISLKSPDGGNIKIAYRIKTKKFVESLKESPGLRGDYLDNLFQSKEFSFFMKRPSTIVVDINSDPNKGTRGFSDPYAGVIASFDYRYCRNITNSKDVKNRDLNLIFMPRHENATKFFEKIIYSQLVEESKIKWRKRRTIEDTLEITKQLFSKGPHTLKKELKNFFYFCDLIVTQQNLFVGKSFLE